MLPRRQDRNAMLVIDAAGSSTSALRLDSVQLALQPDKKRIFAPERMAGLSSTH